MGGARTGRGRTGGRRSGPGPVDRSDRGLGPAASGPRAVQVSGRVSARGGRPDPPAAAGDPLRMDASRDRVEASRMQGGAGERLEASTTAGPSTTAGAFATAGDTATVAASVTGGPTAMGATTDPARRASVGGRSMPATAGGRHARGNPRGPGDRRGREGLRFGRADRQAGARGTRGGPIGRASTAAIEAPENAGICRTGRPFAPASQGPETVERAIAGRRIGHRRTTALNAGSTEVRAGAVTASAALTSVAIAFRRTATTHHRPRASTPRRWWSRTRS